MKYRGLAGVAICILVAACSKSGGTASQDAAPIPVVVAAVEQRELPVVLNAPMWAAAVKNPSLGGVAAFVSAGLPALRRGSSLPPLARSMDTNCGSVLILLFCAAAVMWAAV